MSNTESIEFQDIQKDSKQVDIVRKSYRIPIQEDDDINVVIAGQSYRVIDISISGVAIVRQDTNTLSVSQIYTNCELRYPEGIIKELTAKIIHFTSGTDKSWLNGLMWIDVTKNAQTKINALVKKRKNDLLKSDDIDIHK